MSLRILKSTATLRVGISINFKRLRQSPPSNPQWRELSVLFIDEISMVSPELFTYLDQQAQLSRDSKQPFGGVQLVLCGDFYQLAPVKNKNDISAETYAFETKSWKNSQPDFLFII